MKYLVDTITIIESLQNLSKEIGGKDATLSFYLLEKSYNILLVLVIGLFIKREEYHRNGVTKALLKELRKKNLYPIRYKYSSLKKNIVYRFLNIEWLL